MDASTIQVWRQPFSAKLRFSAVRQSTMDIWHLWVRIIDMIWYDLKKKDSSTVPHFPNKSDRRSPHLMSSDIFSHRGSAAGTSDGCCVVGSLPPCSWALRVAWRRSRLVKWDPNNPMAGFFHQNIWKKHEKMWMFTIYKDLFCDVHCPLKILARSILNSPWLFFRSFPHEKGMIILVSRGFTMTPVLSKKNHGPWHRLPSGKLT